VGKSIRDASRGIVLFLALMALPGPASAQLARVEWLSGDELGVDVQGINASPEAAPARLAQASSDSRVHRFDLSIRRTGLGGLDAGVPENDRWYFLFLVGIGALGSPGQNGGLVLSKFRSYADVVKPPGTTTIRRLPTAVFRNAFGRFRRFRMNPSSAAVDYTDFETSAEYAVLGGGSATAYSRVDLSRLVPPGAGIANLTFAAQNAADNAQTAFLRVPGSSSAGYAIASTSALQTTFVGNLDVQLDAGLGIEYAWNAPGGLLSLFVKGFQYTDLE
jgi:hypothetical protein